jgi:probable HAF family extracellular repeat protein
MKRYTLAAVAGLLLLIPGHESVRADASFYTVQDLGSFNGLVPTITGVNASGQVVGNVNGAQAVRYTPGLGWEAVADLGQSFSWASGINTHGDVVGYYINSTGRFRAYRSRDGVVKDIEPLAGDTMTLGFGIDDAGNVVGVSMAPGGVNHPFLADATTLTAQLVPSLGDTGSACALNAAGQVVGTYNTASGAQHGLRVDPGAGLLDITSLDGPGFTVNACAIDTDGRVGGQFDRASGQTHAFKFSDAGLVDLDSFGSPLSNVESIAKSVSVGWYTLPDFSSTRAFAYTDAEGSFDLNTRIDAPGWLLQAAKGVNANGQIVGEGTLDGVAAVFLLTPQQTAADTVPPVIASHADETAEATGPHGAVVTYAAPATSDAVDGSGTATCAPASGSTFPVGSTTVTCNATDAAGNLATPTTFKVIVTDATAPDIVSLAASPSFIWPANNKLVPVSIAVSAEDDVDGSPVCKVTSVTGAPASDIVMTGPLSAKVRASKDEWGWTVRTYVFEVACSDHSGNASQAAVTVTVGKDAPSLLYHYNRHGHAWLLGLMRRHGRR